MSAMTDIVERLKYATVRGANETNDKAKFRRNRAISDAADEITRLRTALSEAEQRVTDAKRIATNAEHYGYLHGLEAAADIAEAFEPIPKLLPLCNAGENAAAYTGQHEASERIEAAIRALIPSEPHDAEGRE